MSHRIDFARYSSLFPKLVGDENQPNSMPMQPQLAKEPVTNVLSTTEEKISNVGAEGGQATQMRALLCGSSHFKCPNASLPMQNDYVGDFPISSQATPPYVQDMEEPPITGGTSAERAALLSAHNNAEKMLDNAIRTLRDAKTAPNELVEKYFDISGTSPKDQIKLDQLINKFSVLREKSDDVTFEIDHDYSESGVVAWTMVSLLSEQGIGNIHAVNPTFSNEPEPEQSDTIIHELSHYFVGTDDYAYDWQSKFDSLTQAEKMDNADNFGNFAQACSPDLEENQSIAALFNKYFGYNSLESNLNTIRLNRLQLIQC